ncbi:MAG: hypothetical protein RDU76_08325 [Candidatus Edwardsbacteria bacterium]|nr:hypothetical protein [Candidatus Edwardsbacteria bacterium]
MKKTAGIIILILSIAAITAGVFRKELKPLYINAMAICYSCIGLQ